MVKGSLGKLSVAARLLNPDGVDTISVKIDLKDAQGNVISSWKNEMKAFTGDKVLWDTIVKNPKLWSPDQPNLYIVETTVTVKNETSVHQEKIGFRNFEFVKKGPFMLNGKRLLLKGTHRHEDHAGVAQAMTEDMIKQGTGAVEIKSGYGLTFDSELKMLRVIKRLKETFKIPVKASFLAAHTYPEDYKNDHNGYIKLIIDKMLPKIADESLADYMDVFCEKGFFSVDETDKLLEAGAKYGLPPKIHANQLSISGGVQVGVKHDAVSVDHLEATDEGVIRSLSKGKTIATLLPSCSLYLGIPFANARGLINADIPVALASDFNPGSTPSGNMNFVVSLGCIKLKMLPEEAINAATLNGAAAMQLSDVAGSIAVGKKANLFITRPMSSLAYLPYSFGQSQIEKAVLNGEIY